MKRRTLPYFVAGFMFLQMTTACQAPKELVYRDFKNVAVEKLGFGSSTLKLDLVYYNPNNFSLQLKYTDLDIFVDNNFLGHSSQDYQITIQKLAEFTLPLQLEVDMKNILKNALNSILGKEVLIKITGTVKLGKANVYKTFQVNYEGKQNFSVFK